MTADPKHNEFTLINKIMLAMIVISLISVFVSYATGGNTAIACTPGNSGSACQFNKVVYDVNTTFRNLATSFNNATTTPLVPLNNSVLGAPIANFFIAIPNVIAHVFGWYNTNTGAVNGFLINVLLLFADIIYVILFILFGLIPAIISSSVFGPFAPIVTIIEVFTSLMLIGYALYIILNRIPGIG